MVQKKAPDKHGSPGEPKKSHHARPEKRLYSHHQEGRGGDEGNLKKMLRKSRSIKALEESLDLASPLVVKHDSPAAAAKKKRPAPAGLPGAEPNYMKSTSSSNARKEQSQVSSTFSLPATNRNWRPNATKASDRLKPSSGGASSGPKPAKLLARKSSLRPVRPSMKKCLGSPLCPKINASRATCSSTMKETSFPDHLDLNPGGTEVDGTSVFRVCPFTYCSLNGHRHPPLPPLRCFLSARRRLLKTQKSMKLKALSSFRKAAPEAEETGIGAGPSEFPGVSPLVEDLGDDFFVEIYAKGRESPDADGGKKDCEAKIEEDGGMLVDDSGSQASSDDDSCDRKSDFSPSEMEVLINFLEYVECDLEDPSCPSQDHADWTCDSCVPADSDYYVGDLAEGEGYYEPDPKDPGLDYGVGDGLYIQFDEIDYSELAEEESSDGLSFEIGDGTAYGEAPLEVISELVCEEDAEGVVAKPAGNYWSSEFHLAVEAFEKVISRTGEKEELIDVSSKSYKSVGVQVAEGLEMEYEGDTATEETIGAATSTTEDLMGDAPQVEENEVEMRGIFEEQEEVEAAEEAEEQIVSFGADTDAEMRAEVSALQSDSMVPAEDKDMDVDDDLVDDMKTEGEPETTTIADETEDVPGAQNMSYNEKPQDGDSDEEMETGQSDGDDGAEMSCEMTTVSDDKSGASEPCTPGSVECPRDDAAVSSGGPGLVEEHTDAGNSNQARATVVTRKKADEEEAEDLRPFNPRAPNFLPVEPDPEAEKVDLRHQEVDERKNSEEWMIDYALRQAVDKLGTSRKKKKVALLVEAFETVAPMPPYFAHCRPIQACS